MIDWKARFKNKQFLAAMISLTLFVSKNTLGFDFLPDDMDIIADLVLTFVTALGVVVDPSTGGWSDEVEVSDPKMTTINIILDGLKVLTNDKTKR